MHFESSTRCAVVSSLLLVASCPMLIAGQTIEQQRWDMFRKFDRWGELLGWRATAVWGPSEQLWFVRGAPDSLVISIVDPGTASHEEVFDVGRLREAFRAVLGEEPPGRGVPFASFDFIDGDPGQLEVSVGGRTWLVDLRSYAIAPAPSARADACGPPGTARTVSPDGARVAEIRARNLWVGRTGDCSSMAQLTDDGSDWIRYAYGSQPIWSPDGLQIALLRSDFTGVEQTPVVDWSRQPEEVSWVTFPRANGGPMQRNDLVIIDVQAGQRHMVDLPVEEPGQIIEAVAWTLDSEEFLFRRKDRDEQRVDLMAAGSHGSVARIVFSEVSDTSLFDYGSPGSAFRLADGQRFIAYSERDGWWHLYLYELSGKLLRRLTEGPFRVGEVLGVDEVAGWVYFMAQPDLERPYDEHLCRVRLDGTGFTQLTSEVGAHFIQLSPTFDFFLDVHQAAQRAQRAELKRANGEPVMTVAEANTERLNAELRYKPPEEFQVLAADRQTVLWGTMHTPFDFDPSRAYPVLLVVNALGTGFRNQFFPGKPGTFAQLGFVTVELSLRGNIGRDRAFRTAFWGRAGCCEVEDAVAALEQLSRDRPWMDISRVGVLGGSISGYYAARFMLQAPDVFHVGVAERAPMSLGELWGGEAFLGMPSENPDGYAQASNAALAGRLQGKLMLVSYLDDAAMRFASTVRMVEALTEVGRPYDLIVVPQGRRDTDYVWSFAIPRYLVEHLRPWDEIQATGGGR